MKYLIFTALLLSGCSLGAEKQGEVGDCYISGNKLYKILEVGKHSLRVLTSEGQEGTTVGTRIPNQVDCFDRFNKENTNVTK